MKSEIRNPKSEGRSKGEIRRARSHGPCPASAFAASGHISRRQFLQATMAASSFAALPWIIPASARGANGAVPPSERINVGLIGCGMMGAGHLRVLLGSQETQLLAVCDVDRARCEEGRRIADETYAAARASGTYRGCKAYNDYRDVLARADIDAVVIVTPDHWHTLLSIDAAKAGKDVYCEKPVSLTIEEGRRLVETVRRYGRVFQTGTQYRSIPRIRQVCEFVRAGGLGRVKSVFTTWRHTSIPTVGPSFVPLDPPLPAGRGAVGVLRGIRRGRSDQLSVARGGRDSICPWCGNQRTGGDRPSECWAVPDVDHPIRQRDIASPCG